MRIAIILLRHESTSRVRNAERIVEGVSMSMVWNLARIKCLSGNKLSCIDSGFGTHLRVWGYIRARFSKKRRSNHGEAHLRWTDVIARTQAASQFLLRDPFSAGRMHEGRFLDRAVSERSCEDDEAAQARSDSQHSRQGANNGGGGGCSATSMPLSSGIIFLEGGQCRTGEANHSHCVRGVPVCPRPRVLQVDRTNGSAWHGR
jgi:hypothetical protein